jgi:plasmid maintenance system antidote protein VapI
MNQVTQYNPNGLLDEASRILNAKNDAALARKLGVAPPVLSKLRHNRLAVGSSFIIRLMEVADMTLPTIRSFIGGAA